MCVSVDSVARPQRTGQSFSSAVDMMDVDWAIWSLLAGARGRNRTPDEQVLYLFFFFRACCCILIHNMAA